MSFKNKMKNRGISKLDNLIETPSYITPTKPKKFNWNFLKIAIPVTAGLALVIIPVSILIAGGSFNAQNSSKKDGVPSGDSSFDPGYDVETLPGQNSEEVSNIDTSFLALLNNHHINGNYIIEVYDYSDGYMEPTYTFTNEQSSLINDSLKDIKSGFNLYASKLKDAKRNSSSYIMGINHRLIFKDGTNQMVGHYFSQFSSLIIDQSAFDMSTSTAYALMDSYIEMDYDPNFDETIN